MKKDGGDSLGLDSQEQFVKLCLPWKAEPGGYNIYYNTISDFTKDWFTQEFRALSPCLLRTNKMKAQGTFFTETIPDPIFLLLIYYENEP